MSNLLFFDLEADGLYDESTKMHCIVGDGGTGQWTLCPSGLTPSEGGIRHHFEESSRVIAHNGINYDRRMLVKHLGLVIPQEKWVDTMIMSRLLKPDRDKGKYKNPHSIAAWGERLGRHKPEHEDWSVYSTEMLHRCKEDVGILKETYHELLKEMAGHDWKQAMRLEHKFAFIMAEMETKGCVLKARYVQFLIHTMKERVIHLDKELRHFFPPRAVPYLTVVKEAFKKDGSYRKAIADWYSAEELGDPTDGSGLVLNGGCAEKGEPNEGCFQRISYEEINLNSDDQVIPILQRVYGWEHLTVTKKGKPQLTDESLVASGLGKMGRSLLLRRKILKGISELQGWLKLMRQDRRMPCVVNTMGTPTGRVTHRGLANVARATVRKDGTLDRANTGGSFMGTQKRDCFTVPKGKVLIGADAAGLELRMLAHYMNNPAMTKIILAGDFHDVLWQVLKEYVHSRGNTKNVEYAFFYGAGDIKLGTMADAPIMLDEIQATELGWWETDGGWKKMPAQRPIALRGVSFTHTGQVIRNLIATGLPELNRLTEMVKQRAQRGYLLGLDSRKLWLRLDDKGRVKSHTALNLLLQAAGAIVMKQANCYLYDSLLPFGDKAQQVIFYHDEYQVEVDKTLVINGKSEIGDLMVDSMVRAGQHFNLNCPLGGEYKIGRSWAYTH